jgi:DNA-binding transcriptional MerR regulator
VKFVAASRSLDFSLDDTGEILDLRDQREAPRRVVLDLLQKRADEISRWIAYLQRLETELRELHRLGLTFPTDDVDGKEYVCHRITQRSDENIIE